MFAAIGNAVAVLTDTVKRKQYDLYGADEEKMQRHTTRNHHENNYTRGFEGTYNQEHNLLSACAFTLAVFRADYFFIDFNHFDSV